MKRELIRAMLALVFVVLAAIIAGVTFPPKTIQWYQAAVIGVLFTSLIWIGIWLGSVKP